MPDRPITGCPKCPLGEFLLPRFQLLQADDVRRDVGEPAQQHWKAAINTVYVEGRDLHLAPLLFLGTNTIAGPRGKLPTIQGVCQHELASRLACEKLERDHNCSGVQEGEDMADDDALFQKGMPIRREVLGPEYVDASMARADEFMMSFQRATTAWAWGWAWGDATLDRKTRSLMNLAMLTALNRAPEIKLHVKGALNNGVTVEEIKAALLHATAYCGIPAGLDAFRAAHEVLVSEGALTKP
jgi:4-carboxymuconolactone decarboxylase